MLVFYFSISPHTRPSKFRKRRHQAGFIFAGFIRPRLGGHFEDYLRCFNASNDSDSGNSAQRVRAAEPADRILRIAVYLARDASIHSEEPALTSFLFRVSNVRSWRVRGSSPTLAARERFLFRLIYCPDPALIF
jgi:hypothetical protein